MSTAERAESFEREAVPHLDAVYRFALRLTRSATDADDLVQETYLRGYRSWHRYTPGTRARSWLFTICRNAFLRQRARESRRFALARANGHTALYASDQAWMGSLTHGAAAPLPDAVVGNRILRQIDRLPPDFRTAVLLCDLHSIGYADAARELGVPVGTLKSRLHRARRILKKELWLAAADHGLRVVIQ